MFILTQEYLKTILTYSKKTGEFIWLISPRASVKIGQIAGTKNKNGYIHIKIRQKIYLAHRLSWFWMTGHWPKSQMDHINGDKSDNKWYNLREATRQQNNLNRGHNKNNTSGYKGVTWHKQAQKWRARSINEGKRISLGLYDTKEEAINVCIKFSLENHKQFSWYYNG